MRYTLRERGRLLVKAIAATPSSDFRMRPVSVTTKYIKVRITAKRAPVSSVVTLRRGSSDVMSFFQVFVERQYRLRALPQWNSILAQYERCSASGPAVILDLGANIGMSALYFASDWPAAHVLAVEPEAENFVALQANTRSVRHVHPLQAAVASADGAVRIADGGEEAWSKRTETVSEQRMAHVPAMSISTLMQMCPPCACPFLAKVDIEGFEENLFSGNTGWVADFPIIIVELHDWRFPGSGTSRPFFQVMAQQRRDFVLVGEHIVCIAA